MADKFFFSGIQVGNTSEIDWNAGASPHVNALVIPTQIGEN